MDNRMGGSYGGSDRPAGVWKNGNGSVVKAVAKKNAKRVVAKQAAVVKKVKAAKKGELPAGLLFIAYGDYSSRLMGADTHGSGMPTSKGIDVTMEKIAAPSE